MEAKSVLRNFSIAIAWSFGLFLSSCSMSSDMVEEDPRSPLVLHAQIQDLANKYGLNIEINDSALAANAETINLKQMESDFKSLAQLKGRYEMNVDGNNRLLLDTHKERQLMKNLRSAKKLRTLTSSPYERTSGEHFQTCSNNTFTVSFLVVWVNNPRAEEPEVKIEELCVMNSGFAEFPEVGHVDKKRVGGSGKIEYSFKIKFFYKVGNITLPIHGDCGPDGGTASIG